MGSNVSLAVQHAHQTAESHWQQRFDIIITLMPAIAARSSPMLRHMLSEFSNYRDLPSAISCARTHPWLWKISRHGVQNTWHPNSQSNSQDLPLYLVEHASIIINRRECVVSGLKSDFTLMIYTLPSWAVALDIDDQQDLEHAKSLYPSMAPLLEDWKGETYVVNTCDTIQPD